MRYLLLIYGAEEGWAALSPEEQAAEFGDYVKYTQWLRDNGWYEAGEALQSISSATTVRVREGETMTTDGPFAETKEQLGGFVLIEARDLNEAIRVASKIPPGRLGCVEVRPVQELGCGEGR